MADAREAMLERIRSATASDARTDAAAEYARVPRNYIHAGELNHDERIAMLVERLHEYDANVVETSTDSLPRTIASVLEGHGQRKVISAEELPPEMLPRDFTFISERDAGLDELNACDGIVTLCTVAIAFTGTIVLTHGPGEGARRLTLVPDRHLCVVRGEQVVETVPEAFARLAGRATQPITFISGPSATADIEMTRIRGVHGPRFLDVVLVRDPVGRGATSPA